MVHIKFLQENPSMFKLEDKTFFLKERKKFVFYIRTYQHCLASASEAEIVGAIFVNAVYKVVHTHGPPTLVTEIKAKMARFFSIFTLRAISLNS